MFTGLVEGIGSVRAVILSGQDMRLTISPQFDMSDTRLGDSISVNGVCLTVTDLSGEGFSVDVSRETLSRSTLGYLKRGEKVNLERALRLNDRLGGHMVLGHVDGMGRILKKEQKDRSWVFRISLESRLSRYLVEKGSVAVDGVSLTVNQWDRNGFEVNIIAQTGKETTILNKRVGDPVNIETDLIGKYVEKFLQRNGFRERTGARSPISEEMLRDHGFGD